jgi:very-short-patch-repair endonuclease
LLTVTEDTGREPDSDFEISVMDVLRARGYKVEPQLGVAGYRIDIAVEHPDAPGTYLAAIECDGASYHSALSVRDRDRIRQEILESLGWRDRIWRIWSTDWFRTPRQEIAKLIRFLDDTRANWKPEHLSGDSWVEEGVAPSDPGVAQVASEEVARQEVSDALLDTEDDIEVEVGDVVRYVDVQKSDDILTIRITQKSNDLPNGLISAATPLAQTLLGAVAGDEVTLHIPGVSPRMLRIIEIKRVAKS